MVERGSQRIPAPLAPPFLHERMWGISAPTLQTNPLGLCCFYHVDPSSTSTLTSPKPPAMAEHVKSLLLLAKMQQWPYIIIVFQGRPVTALGLLQELHMWSALAHIPIYQSDETKDRHKPCMSCCPFCAYTIQNDLAYLNHIIGMHYNTNFMCGTCLSAVTSRVNR